MDQDQKFALRDFTATTQKAYVRRMKYRIREHRTKRGWTLDQLADEVGTSKGYLSDLERGKRTGGIEMIRSIAQALKVSEAEIFTPDTDEERAMLDHVAIYQQLSREDQDAIARMARGLLAASPRESST